VLTRLLFTTKGAKDTKQGTKLENDMELNMFSFHFVRFVMGFSSLLTRQERG